MRVGSWSFRSPVRLGQQCPAPFKDTLASPRRRRSVADLGSRGQQIFVVGGGMTNRAIAIAIKLLAVVRGPGMAVGRRVLIRAPVLGCLGEQAGALAALGANVAGPLGHEVEDRCEEDAEQSDAEHAAEDSDAQGLA